MKNADVNIIDWMNKHEKELRRYQGKCVAIRPGVGIVAVARTMKEASKKARGKYPTGLLHYDYMPRKLDYYIF